MALLEFARGPGLWLAFAIFVAGSAWRAFAILRRPSATDLSQARSGALLAGGLRGIARRMWQPASLRRRSLTSTVFGYGYHIGLAIVFFGFVPHIAFVQRLTGLTWPALPGPVFAAGVAMAFVGLFYALMARLTSPVLRLLSTFDDYSSWTVTFLPLLTGMAVLALSLESAYPLTPDLPVIVALHLLAFELLLVWLPFSKLSHAVLVFVSRATTGAANVRKGAMP